MIDKKTAAISVSAGVVCGVSGALLITAVYCLICVKLGSVQQSMYVPVSIISACFGAFVSGFVCSKVIKHSAVVFGAVCAILVFAVMFVLSILSGAQADVHCLLRLAAMLPIGALGGVLAVSKGRKKRRRKR